MNVDYCVIGGGISGLARAYTLKQSGYSVVLLEARREVGGNIQTFDMNGFRLEQGPNSLMENNDALKDLIKELSLDVVEANSLANNRFVLKKAQLHALPMSLGSFIKTPLFPFLGKLRLLKEPFIGKSKDEETIKQFVTRRLGQAFFEYAIDPFVSGVYAGNSSKLSVQAATQKIYALEAEHGGLFRGLLAKRKQGYQGRGQPKGRLISFAGGMQDLPLALAKVLGNSVLCNEAVSDIQHDGQQWQITSRQAKVTARHVVLATPAKISASLLSPLDGTLAQELASIVYPPVASVGIGFNRKDVNHPLNGFGALFPRKEDVQTLGVLFNSTLFEQRAPEGQVLLTAFIGGRTNESIAEMDEAQILQQVINDLTPILGLQGEAVFSHVTLWTDAIPQYEIGYLDKLERINMRLNKLPNLTTCANWHDGISVGDCVSNGINVRLS